MNACYLLGIAMLVAGALMIACSSTLGAAFCRLGKAMYRRQDRRSSALDWIVDLVFHEQRTPTVFRFLGVVGILLSPLLWYVGWLLSSPL